MSVACIILTRDMSVRRDVEDALRIAMDQARESGITCEYQSCSERYGVALGRNRSVASFLQTDYTHLLFVDDDVVVPPNAINDLLECESDIAGGCYVMLHPINGRATPVLTVLDGDSWRTEWFDGVVDAERVATGCMLIRREVFDGIGKPGEWFRWPSWLENGVLKHRSDDVEFCRQALECGFTIRAHGNVRCGHMRTVDLGCLLPGRLNLTQESYRSHEPVLHRIGQEFMVSEVLEFGAGLYSTPLFLDRMAFPYVTSVTSYENDMSWFSRVSQEYGNDDRLALHRSELEDMPRHAIQADLAFIDCDDRTAGKDSYSTRATLIRECSDTSGIVVVHDAQEPAITAAIKASPCKYKTFIKNRGLPETAVLSNIHDVTVLQSRSQEPVNA